MEKLYNNIILPDEWPPRNVDLLDERAPEIPYLKKKPDVIDISVGRQLFVDDFLIASTDLSRFYHKAVKYEGNPVFVPETPLETDFAYPGACPKSGGVWYDRYQGKYRMWYEAGWLYRMAYAESDDGIHWVRPSLDVVPGTNEILPDVRTDSTTVFIDYDTDKEDERYKMFVRSPGGGAMPGYSYVSSDGIHWGKCTETDPVGDRSTIFYNPFRKKWVYSIRSGLKAPFEVGRVRYYRECNDFLAGAKWVHGDDPSRDEQVPWLRADRDDKPDPDIRVRPQLYNFDAVGYESIMLGLFEIHRGPDNKECAIKGKPKITELVAAYSRDGFHFYRPDREPLIPASRETAEWDRGYVQSVGGICLVMKDELWFYYIGYEGDGTRSEPQGPRSRGVYCYGSTGIAKIRRDGFVSLDGMGSVLTEKLCTGSGHKYLFINAKAPHGSVRAELLDADGEVIEGYSAEESIPFTGNSTCVNLSWNNQNTINIQKDTPFRLRFIINNAQIYSFWLSDTKEGKSSGPDAAGGNM